LSIGHPTETETFVKQSVNNKKRGKENRILLHNAREACREVEGDSGKEKKRKKKEKSKTCEGGKRSLG